MRITHIAPLSVGKVAFVLYACLGLIACIFFVPMLLFTTMGQESGHGLPFGAAFGVAMVIVMPFVYGGLAALFAMAATVIYNIVAGMVGGVELTIEPRPTAR